MAFSFVISHLCALYAVFPVLVIIEVVLGSRPKEKPNKLFTAPKLVDEFFTNPAPTTEDESYYCANKANISHVFYKCSHIKDI